MPRWHLWAWVIIAVVLGMAPETPQVSDAKNGASEGASDPPAEASTMTTVDSSRNGQMSQPSVTDDVFMQESEGPPESPAEVSEDAVLPPAEIANGFQGPPESPAEVPDGVGVFFTCFFNDTGSTSASSSSCSAAGSSSSSSSWRRTPGAHLLQSKSNEGRFPSVVMIDPYFRDVALSNLLHWLEEDTAPPSEEPSSGQRPSGLQGLTSEEDPVSPSNAAGEALAAHAQEVAAANGEASTAAAETPAAEDAVSPSNAAAEALAAHAQEMAAANGETSTAAAETPAAEDAVSPSNAAAEALAAHAQEEDV